MLVLLFMFSSGVFALDNLNIDYELKGDKYELIIKNDDQIVSYEDAIEKYNIDEYIKINIDGIYHYFYLGEEISGDKYEKEVEMYEITKECEKVNAKCLRVESTEDLINNVEKIYSSKELNIYHLLYSSDTYKDIDFEYFSKFYEEKIVGDYHKNMYKYDEYYFRSLEKSMPYYDENRVIINNFKIKTTDEEIDKVDKFLDEYLKLFEGKSDYEKIMGVYTYINNTAVYQNDDGYVNFLDGQLSAYDVLIKHKAVCIGLSTTFQLLMERLGIESYIVDHVSSKSDEEYITTHTYNIVKLDNEWYIVDIPLDGSLNGLLKGMSDNYSLEDFKYYDIKIADNSYLDTHNNASKDFDFDYASLLDLTQRIDTGKEEKKDVIETIKKNNTLEYVLIVGILAVIMVIIYIFTRKK